VLIGAGASIGFGFTVVGGGVVMVVVLIPAAVVILNPSIPNSFFTGLG